MSDKTLCPTCDRRMSPEGELRNEEEETTPIYSCPSEDCKGSRWIMKDGQVVPVYYAFGSWHPDPA
jgi:hypothetical protein